MNTFRLISAGEAATIYHKARADKLRKLEGEVKRSIRRNARFAIPGVFVDTGYFTRSDLASIIETLEGYGYLVRYSKSLKHLHIVWGPEDYR